MLVNKKNCFPKKLDAKVVTIWQIFTKPPSRILAYATGFASDLYDLRILSLSLSLVTIVLHVIPKV